MAKAIPRKLSWITESNRRLGTLTSDYNTALEEIAAALAKHEGADRVMVKHVDEAFRVLAASSNNRRPWYARHESEIAAGSVLFTGSFSLAENVTKFLMSLSWCQDWNLSWLTPSLTAALLLFGVLLVLHGFLRQRGILWSR
jgi:hypothetical protein